MILIRVKNLWKSYRGVPVLKGLDLEVEQGETLVIIGRSGAGKSVLLKQLMGLETPDSGLVEVNGIAFNSLKKREFYQALKQMGMLFQGGALFDSMTVGENVAFYLTENKDPETNKSFHLSEIQERVSESLELVGLKGLENELPSNLSGGMRKRAALARMIAYRPHILLYDEPTTGLDPITSSQINALILTIQKKFNATSIVVTHDFRSAFEVANRIALHDDGKIPVITDKEGFMNSEHPLIKNFLENALLRGL